MPNSVLGLPLHPLVVHAVVVLLPLAALGVVALAVVPRWRKPYGLLLLVVATAAIVPVPVASDSGESLQASLPTTALIQRHAQLGETLKWFAIPLWLVALLLWWLGRSRPGGRVDGAALAAAVVVVAVLIAVGATLQVFRVGHSGAQATWSAVKVTSSGG